MKRFRAGEVVVWRSVSLDHFIGRAWPMTVVGDEEDLIAVYLRPATVFKIATGMMGGPRDRVVVRYDGRHRDAVWRAVDALILYRPGDAHCVWRFQRADDQRLTMWYVNLEEPWTRTSRGFDSRDHGLDAIVEPDLSSWSWKDEDEIEWALAHGQLSAAEVAAYRAEGERAAARIMRHEPPFDREWAAWRPDPAWAVPVLPEGWDAFDT
jgi:hypothetical protein